MKTNRSLALTGMLLLLAHAVFSQAICGFDAVHNKRLQKDPSYRQNVLDGEAAIRTYLRQHPKLGQPRTTIVQGVPGNPAPLSALYTIPVVVHVIHTGGAIGTIYNPTDAQILGALAYLNSVYNGTESHLSGGVGDLQIQFALAQRDPNCNATNGINRVDGSGVAGYVSGGVNASTTGGADEVSVKDLSRWNTSQYYNIWIVDKIDGNDGTSGQFIAGFAYFPGASTNVDGIVMLATQMVAGQKTLPHEIGHAFNLYHPFQGSSNAATCPANTFNDCTLDGDQVCDTDPISENMTLGVLDGTCRTGTNSCTGGAYSINTESNYMNYSNCYTLFTAGQKARMLAAAAAAPRSSLSASLGATAPNAGGSPCGPKINFELTGDQETETTVTSGCRPYKDYSYNMVIGSSPSAAATATINIGAGTAIQGVDFDLTTNGSFTVPSNIVNFPAGSAATQPFTIRVYDDASINGTRSVALSYTVNNGGGNAVLGNGRPNFTMIINDNDLPPHGPTNVTASIGSDQGSLQSPFVGASAKEKTQILYYASELLAAGVKAGPINGLGLNIDKVSGAGFVYTGLTIRMAQTTQTSLNNGSTEWPLLDGAFTTVYSTNVTTASGWNNFTFTSPFTWDGTSNIVVGLCYDNGATTGSTDLCRGFVDGSGKKNYIFAAVNCGTAISSFSNYTGAKPIARFVYPDPGDSVQTIISSRQQYLGPNADVYFFSQSDNKLLARIQNLSSFDYGCTQVLVDRIGMGSTAFWNNNTANYLMNKTIKVIPTTNNTSGSYNITLYYTPNEVSGWQTATGQTLSNIRLVKVGSQISDVTPASPTAGGAVVIGAPTIGTMGVNTSLTYNFTTGFSGFGAGVPGLSTLPLGLLDFTGRQQRNTAVLNWNTAFETGTRRFGVERSYDGSRFDNIGFVDAAGTSTTTHSYSFTDPLLAEGNNYYRLREIDLDNKFTYSKTLLINNADPNNGLTVMPSPFSNSLDILFGHTPAGKVNIRLLDLTGHQLFRKDNTVTGSDRIHLDLSGIHLSAGIYLLKVSSGNSSRILKVLKN